MILFYDTETTGLPLRKLDPALPEQPRIVQLAAIMDFDDGKEAMRLDVILDQPSDDNPNRREQWLGAMKSHGIAPEVSRQIGVTEVIALELFLDMLAVSDLIVGQNITGFDNGIVTGALRRALDRPSLDPFKDKKIFDTMLAGKPMCKLPSRQGGLKNPTLTELHKHLFREGFDGAHEAISDVLATRRCFYRMQEIMRERQAA